MSRPEVRQMWTEEVLEAIEAGRVPVVPVATLETHDPHLPVDVDVVCAEEVALRAARERPDLGACVPTHRIWLHRAHPRLSRRLLDQAGGLARVLLRRRREHRAKRLPQAALPEWSRLERHDHEPRVASRDARIPGLCAATSWWICAARRARACASRNSPGAWHTRASSRRLPTCTCAPTQCAVTSSRTASAR